MKKKQLDLKYNLSSFRCAYKLTFEPSKKKSSYFSYNIFNYFGLEVPYF